MFPRTSAWNDRIEPEIDDSIERDIRRRRIFQTIATIGPTVVYVVVFIPGTFEKFSSPLTVLACLVAGGTSSIAAASSKAGLKGLPPRIEGMLEDSEARDEYPVAVRIVSEGLIMGDDEGFLVVVDGWLVFHGFRSHFSLSPADILKIEDASSEHKLNYHQYEIRLRSGKGGPAVLLGEYPEAKGAPERYPKLINELRRFAGRKALPEGMSVLPPSVPHVRRLRHAELQVAAKVGQLWAAGIAGLGATVTAGLFGSLIGCIVSLTFTVSILVLLVACLTDAKYQRDRLWQIAANVQSTGESADAPHLHPLDKGSL